MIVSFQKQTLALWFHLASGLLRLELSFLLLLVFIWDTFLKDSARARHPVSYFRDSKIKQALTLLSSGAGLPL